ncbi:MAG: AAA family ATPase [Verrucomicrobia bacterium]|nr:AAA family ATPase [Verrucomicrobiota bacterium]
MIQKLSIRNFKSIRELDLDCRRVNVFIGEPNVGKTNILEALGLWNLGILGNIRKCLRVERLADLNFDTSLNRPATEVVCDDCALQAIWLNNGASLEYAKGAEKHVWRIDMPSGDVDAVGKNIRIPEEILPVEYYLFDPHVSGKTAESDKLLSPDGGNFGGFLANNRDARIAAAAFFENGRYRLAVDRSTYAVFLAREEDGTIITLPYMSASETVRRMVFYSLVIGTHEHSILVFDEPEAHAFPPYTKTLAESIALDDRGNQFFLTTHSPYMLDSLLSKTPVKDLNVVLCRMENFETKAYPMNQEQIDQIKEWSMDAFFNFDRLLPEVG